LDYFIIEINISRQFYHRYAYLRDSERVGIMIDYFKALAKVKISAPINSSFLNSWTPSPLILAGLISGHALKGNLSINTPYHTTFSIKKHRLICRNGR